MPNRDAIYDLLLDYANLQVEIERVMVGLDWTLVQAGATGIAATVARGQWQRSPDAPLVGRSLAEVALWLRKWERQQAVIGLAAVNAAINSEADMIYQEGALFRGRNALDNALEWFLPHIQGSKVALLGQQNPFIRHQSQIELTHLPGSNGSVHPAAEVMLGKAEWVFVPGQAVADKTLPRILELARDAKIVLYGPQVPWLEEWHGFGIDYLVGSQIDHSTILYSTIAEGGGIESLPQAVSYRLCDLGAQQAHLPLHEAAGGMARH